MMLIFATSVFFSLSYFGIPSSCYMTSALDNTESTTTLAVFASKGGRCFKINEMKDKKSCCVWRRGCWNTQTFRTGAPVIPHAAAAAEGSMSVQVESSICHFFQCRCPRKSCKLFSILSQPARRIPAAASAALSFFFFRWQLIRRLRLSAAPSQQTGRNLLLGKSNTSVRLTLRAHQSEEPVIFLHPSTFIFLSVKLNAALLPTCGPQVMHQRGSRRSRNTCAPELMRGRDVDCIIRRVAVRPRGVRRVLLKLLNRGLKIKWSLGSSIYAGEREREREREKTALREVSCLCHLDYVRSSPGARGSSRLWFCTLFLALHNGADGFPLLSVRGTQSATPSQKTLCEKTPVIHSFIHLYIYLFVLFFLLTSVLCEGPKCCADWEGQFYYLQAQIKMRHLALSF